MIGSGARHGFCGDRRADLPTAVACRPRTAARAGHLVGGERLVPEETAIVVPIFLAAFATLTISFWPYMIPFVLTIDEAAAPRSSLAFMFWGEGLFVPLMLLYTIISYRVFRGKVASTPEHSETA